MEPISVDTLMAMASIQGYSWTREEVEALRSRILQGLELVEKLKALPLKDVEPAVGYRLL